MTARPRVAAALAARAERWQNDRVHTPRSLLVVALCAGCSAREAPPSLDVFGSAIAPPPPLDQLKIGMRVEEATRLVPALVADPGDAGKHRLSYDLGRRGVRARVDLKGRHVSGVWVHVDRPSFERELVAKWGPSKRVSDGIVEWAGPAWRASHSCTPEGARCAVHFGRPARPITPAFFGTKPQPVGALAGIEFGMTAKQAKAIAPHLVGPVEEIYDDGGADDVMASVFVDDAQHVRGLSLDVPNAAMETMRAAWGAHQLFGRSRHAKARPCWLGETWRACIAHAGERWSQIDFEPHLPLARLLGDGPALAYFADRPLLGATRQQIEQAYRLRKGADELELPANELSVPTVKLDYQDGVVHRAQLILQYEPEHRDAVYAALAAKWQGPPAVPPEDKPVTLRAKAPRVVVEDIGSFWQLTLTR
jgi:hypothetical protein